MSTVENQVKIQIQIHTKMNWCIHFRETETIGLIINIFELPGRSQFDT